MAIFISDFLGQEKGEERRVGGAYFTVVAPAGGLTVLNESI